MPTGPFYVAPRPRKAIVEAEASTDPRWKVLQNDIDAFLEKVKRGDDLTPHLSLDPHTLGYTPAASAQGGSLGRQRHGAERDGLSSLPSKHDNRAERICEPNE